MNTKPQATGIVTLVPYSQYIMAGFQQKDTRQGKTKQTRNKQVNKRKNSPQRQCNHQNQTHLQQ